MPIMQRTAVAKTKFGKSYTEGFLMRGIDPLQTRLIDWAQGSALFVALDVF